jgi:hypothetical protein
MITSALTRQIVADNLGRMWGAFGLGLAIGVPIGAAIGLAIYFVGRHRLLSDAKFPPEAKALFDCMYACGQIHSFGSDDFNRCVSECQKRKMEQR